MQDGISSTQLLHTLLQRENLLYQEFPLNIARGEGVLGWRERNRECAGMVINCRRLGLGMDAMALSLAIFDKVVTSTRVPTKYANCVAVASLSVAKKLCEDHEEDAPVFLERLRLEYSARELKRMELRILEVLRWDAHLPNVYRFVECLLSHISATFLLGSIKCHIEAILCDSNIIANFRPSVIAVSIVSLLVEVTNRHWQTPVQQLSKLCKIGMPEVMRCRTRVSNLWNRRSIPMPTAYNFLDSGDEMEADSEGSTNNKMMMYPSEISTSSTSENLISITSPLLRQLQATPC